jgi:aminoglycoside phosphotransferase family enzyme/predicted kinase
MQPFEACDIKEMTTTPDHNASHQNCLVQALNRPSCYSHPVDRVEIIETHISYILLAGDFAYKIKKPLNLGFLDFTSLERRKYYCFEELRLNRRLAPDLYLDCIPICGTTENPVLGHGDGPVLEYALVMVRFPQDGLLSRCLTDGRLQPRHIDELAGHLAEFHGVIARAGPGTAFGAPAHVHQPALDNFRDIRALRVDSAMSQSLDCLERWTVAAYQRLESVLATRKAEGFIRECHGDLHLGNMILQDDRVVIFDCIEFNDELRWIDVLNDTAFLYMDLCKRGAPGLARRLLNVYLEHSGDYAGLPVLRYYLVYRAMVRAKIAAIRLSQFEPETEERHTAEAECRDYLRLASSFTRDYTPFLLITHGLSGSGKTHLTGRLLETLEAVRIRSDVERKRLFGLKPLADSSSGPDQGIYTRAAGERTYQRLQELARRILAAGYSVLVDATFLERERRQGFRDLAMDSGVSFVLLACGADADTLRARVQSRQARGGDAAEADSAILERQLAHYAPPGDDESPLNAGTLDIDTLSRIILARAAADSTTIADEPR